MKRIEVFISEGEADRCLGTLEYDELRGKEVSSFELDGDFVLHPSVGYCFPRKRPMSGPRNEIDGWKTKSLSSSNDDTSLPRSSSYSSVPRRLSASPLEMKTSIRFMNEPS